MGQGRDFIEINGLRNILSVTSKSFCSVPTSRADPRGTSPGANAHACNLAWLFSQPVNVLVLDEPTNDLDVETLELLEQLLADFDGTILLVSHDREFLDNVVTSSLVFEGNGRIEEYVGGYSDWLRSAKSRPLKRPRPINSPIKPRLRRATKPLYQRRARPPS